MAKIRVLELFCGTKSIGKHCAKAGDVFEVVSLDVDPKCNPTHLSDILSWDYRAAYPPHHFQILWSSPPCTHYSILRTTGGPRDIEGANQIVQRTLEIIRYFEPHVWFLENPASGYLKNQGFMQELPFVDVHYCKYGYPYRKWTRIWTNVRGFTPRLCHMDCEAMVVNPLTGCPRHRGTFGGDTSRTPLRQRYSIPPQLVADLFDAALKQVPEQPIVINRAQSISSGMGGRRVPIRIRATRTDDPSHVQEFASISEAAKAITGQCPQNNVRAALTRCLASGAPLAGRNWEVLEDPTPTTPSPSHAPSPPAMPQPIANEALLKAKQIELLLTYLQKVQGAEADPTMLALVKSFLM
jgi:hypothetical protein